MAPAARLHGLPAAEVPGGFSAATNCHWLLMAWERHPESLPSVPWRDVRYERVLALACPLVERKPDIFGHG